MEELFQVVKQGKPNKAPGQDGIYLEFIKHGRYKIWPTRRNEQHVQRRDDIRPTESWNTSLPAEKAGPTRVEDYRPLTLMNTDYKLFTRIIANRLRPWLVGLLQSSQHCELPVNTVFKAVATVRDAVAYAEAIGIPMCVQTINLKEAFDKIYHSYLYALLRKYGVTDRLQQRIRNI